MHSIRTRFIVLNLVSILLCALLVGGTSLFIFSKTQTASSDQIMSLTCQQQGDKLDTEQYGIESSVDIFAEAAMNRLESTERLGDAEYAADFVADMDRLMHNIARNTRGVCAYYLRVAPELTEGPVGFLYVDDGDSDEMRAEPLTDLSAYDIADRDRVGWYYMPREAGRAIWMEPYYNANLNTYIISYIAPLYLNGAFWGVAGMDIDFNVVVRGVQRIKAYRTGYALLTSKDGRIFCHPTLEPGGRVANYVPELARTLEAMADAETDAAALNRIYFYRYEGVNKKLTFCPLRNGMLLLLTAENNEINAPMRRLFLFVLVFALLLAGAGLLIAVAITNRITRPLRQLTDAAHEIAEGNLNVIMPPAGEDEVGSLTRSLTVTMQSLREYIVGMSSIAYIDPLTHVKNKAAYDVAEQRLQNEIDAHKARFGFVMIDLNNLKQVNDLYGHEKGNYYLVNGVRMVCGVFKNSPVFRIGGDEFLVLLERSDYLLIDRLMETLDRHMHMTDEYPEPWRRVSMAKGLSVYAPGDRTPDDVFRRADEAMYADKRRIKQEMKSKTE